MGRVGQWARIEAPAAAPGEPAAAARDARAPGAVARRAVRLKPDDRLVLGSIDAGAHVLQRHTPEAVVGSAVLLLPAIVANLLLSTLVFDRFEALSGSAVAVPEPIGLADSATTADRTVAYVAMVATSLAVALAGGYPAAVYVDATFGRPVSMRAARRRTWRHLPGAWSVGHVWFFLAALVLLVPPAVVVEECGAGVGLRRSVRLARSRFAAAVGHPWHRQVHPETFLLCAIARHQRQHLPGCQPGATPVGPPPPPFSVPPAKRRCS
ncbi:MAG: hypothetical protein QM733_12965 [Ilumatobacteraceae bacterium]